MSASGRPWWASDAEHGRIDNDDPVTRHRAARRGNRDRAACSDENDSSDHDPNGCGVCPICSATRWVQQHRPEVLTHLGEAAHHVAMAAKAFIDHAAEEGAARRDVAADDDED